MAEKLLTIRDVSLILGITEKDVIDLSEKGAIPAYKIGGIYLRFKREQIEEFRRSFKNVAVKAVEVPANSLKDKVSDFLYFNDFYILSVLIILSLLVIIFRGY